MTKTLLSDRLMYLLAFCVSSAWFFSNLGKDSFSVGNTITISVGNTITIFSITLALFLVRAADIIFLFIMSLVILISSIAGALSSGYFINFSYKILSFLPVVILVKRASIDIVYAAVLHSFLLSTLVALLLLMLGYSAPKFIIYNDVIPRFAALAIEPVSYALGTVVLFIFFLIRHRGASLFVSILFYTPIIAAVSGVVLIKVAIDFLSRIRFKHILLSGPFVFFVILLLLNETRAGESIDMRLFLYGEILKTTDNSFLGSGFYAHDGAKGLPGIARIFYELGFIFLCILAFYYSIFIIKFRLFRWPFLFVGIAIPFITEAYGAPLLWLVSMYCLHRGREYLSGSTVVMKS